MTVMLACRGVPRQIDHLQAGSYLFDLKVDGVRCLVTVEDGRVRLTSRAGTPMTARYPEVVAALKDACPSGRLALDAELAVCDDRGLPSWPLTHKRDAQQSRLAQWAQRLPARLFVFDVLEVAGTDLRGWAYANRRQVLDQEARSWPAPTVQPTLFSADGSALWRVVCEHRMEGMMAKRAESPYRPGRSQDWVKIKRTSTVTCLVGGSDPGTGSRSATFGNLHLYLLDADQRLVPVGRVGSGFSDREIRRVMQALHRPPLIVEVEYLDVSPDGQLRQPVFQRIRHDAAVTDCTLDQLIGGGHA